MSVLDRKKISPIKRKIFTDNNKKVVAKYISNNLFQPVQGRQIRRVSFIRTFLDLLKPPTTIERNRNAFTMTNYRHGLDVALVDAIFNHCDLKRSLWIVKLMDEENQKNPQLFRGYPRKKEQEA
jgi:hypothetical protein